VTTSSGQLPYTGANAGLLALAGALCIGGGVALRVRLREQ
jgi:LPXTG-motif cell wall-anchored protein